MHPVEMIAWFTQDGVLNPVRFKLDGEVYKVEQIINRKEEKLAGNRMIIYRCQSDINGQLKPFELKYEIQTCKWYLWKM